VRAHLYASEGRANDTDVPGATVKDTHEPAVGFGKHDLVAEAFGLHTTHRAKLAAAPYNGTRRYQSAVEYRARLRYRRQGTSGTQSTALYGTAAAHQRCGAAGREPRCAGTQEGTQQCARTVMFTRVEPTTLKWPVPWEREKSPPEPRLACIPHAAKA
jgi:hypothetical protein